MICLIGVVEYFSGHEVLYFMIPKDLEVGTTVTIIVFFVASIWSYLACVISIPLHSNVLLNARCASCEFWHVLLLTVMEIGRIDKL